MRALILSFPIESAAGGGERYLEDLVEGLAPDVRFRLLSSSNASLEVFRRRGWDALPLWAGVEPVSRLALPLFLLTLPLFLPLMLAVLAYERARGASAVVCLAMGEKLVATPIARLLGMRVVWMEHLVAGRPLVRSPLRGLYAALSRFARVVVVSKAIEDSLAAVGVPRARMTTIFPGVAGDDYPETTHRGTPIIGTTLRLHPEKNVTLLLRAFALVAKRVPEAKLEIVGDGPERAALEREAERLGLGARVAFRGRVVDAGRRCGEFSVFALPSSRESFGIAALEAMACGTPVVATRVGGLPELVLDGETGILVPPEDEAAMADAIYRLLTDSELAARLGRAGRARALTSFTVARMLSAWRELLKP